jgi:hypothetical protein
MCECFDFGFENMLIGWFFSQRECLYPARKSDVRDEPIPEQEHPRNQTNS